LGERVAPGRLPKKENFCESPLDIAYFDCYLLESTRRNSDQIHEDRRGTSRGGLFFIALNAMGEAFVFYVGVEHRGGF
jgi:hypothetical protein